MPPNKNQKCPCGSGRKYKQCCGKRRSRGRDREQIRKRHAGFTDQDRTSAELRLRELVEDLNDEAENKEAWSEFLPDDPGPVHELPRSLQRSLDELFGDWFAFDRPWKGGARPVERLLEQEDLGSGERRWLKRMRDSVLGVWEVTSSPPGRPMRLYNLLSSGTVTLQDNALRRTLGDARLFAGRVLAQGKNGAPGIEGAWAIFDDGAFLGTDDAAQFIIDHAESLGHDLDHATLQRAVPPLYAKLIIAAADEDGNFWDEPQDDNDDFQPIKLHYAVRDAEALRAAFSEHPGIHRHEEDEADAWIWIEGEEDDPDNATAIGHLDLVDGALVLSTLSKTSADMAEDLLEDLTGRAIEFQRRELGDVEELLEQVEAMLAEEGEL